MFRFVTLIAVSLLGIGCNSAVAESVETQIVTPEPVTYPLPEPIVTEPEPERLREIRVCLEVYPTSVAETELAIEGWALTSEKWRDWKIVKTECDLTIREVLPTDGFCRETAAACVHEIGGLELPEPTPSELYLVSGKHERWTRTVVMHEIGHLLGLTHRDGGLMEAEWDATERKTVWECPDAESVDRLSQRVGGAELVGCETPIP